MRAATIVAILSAMSYTALAMPAPAPEDASDIAIPEDLDDGITNVIPDDIDAELEDDDEPEGLEKRDFGCNWKGGNDGPCHKHCKSIKGYKGGNCIAITGVCKCY